MLISSNGQSTTTNGKVLNTNVHCLLTLSLTTRVLEAPALQSEMSTLSRLPFSSAVPLSWMPSYLLSSQRNVPLNALPTPGSIVA